MKIIYRCFCLIFVTCLLSFAQYPDIEISPDTLIDTLSMGETSTHWITVSNVGDSDLIFYVWCENNNDNNYGLLFNGSSSYVGCPNSPSLNIQQSLTLEAWCYPFDWNGNRRILQKGNNDDQYRLMASGQEFHINIQFTDGWRLDVPAALPTVNRWHHVAGVYDHADSMGYLYIDGQIVPPVSGNGTIEVTSDLLYIGTKHEWAPPGDYFNGYLDEVRIWNTARTGNQIRHHMYRALSGSEPGLAAYWDFNEGSGFTAFDKSPNHNDGMLYGGVAWVDSAAPLLSWISITPTQGVVPPDSSTQLEVTLDATSLWGGDYYQEIVVISNDPEQPEVIVPVYLHVNGEPDITLSDDTLDFGIVIVGSSASQTLEILNEGDAILVVDNVTSDNPDYTVDSTSFSVIPNSQHELLVTFTPSTPGVSTATLSISSNDPDEPVVTVFLIGAGMTGIAEGGNEILKTFSIADIHPNPFREKVDIRWQITESGQYIDLKIYDISGRLVKAFCQIPDAIGMISWDGYNQSGRKLPTGVYFLEFTVDDTVIVKKAMLIR